MRISPRLVRELAGRGLRHLVPLLLVLAAEAEGSAVRLSQPELAARLALDVSTVRRQELLLEQLGILRIVRGGMRNRRMLVLEQLDVQDLAPARTQPAAPAAVRQLELFHEHSTVSPQVAAVPARPCAVSSARETAHGRTTHIRLARAGARAEEPLSVSSARSPAAAPWSPWRSRQAVTAAASRACRMPEWQGPSRAVDELVLELHGRLNCFENTLRNLVIFARDHCTKHGEAETLRYVAALARWCLLVRKNPAGSFYARMKQWRLKIAGAAAPPQQHVLEDVERARHISGLLHAVLPMELRHG